MATTLPNTGAIIPAMTEQPDQAVNNAAFTAIDAAVKANADNIGLLKSNSAKHYLYYSATDSWQTMLANRVSELPVDQTLLLTFNQNGGRYYAMGGINSARTHGAFIVINHLTVGITYRRLVNGTWSEAAVT